MFSVFIYIVSTVCRTHRLLYKGYCLSFYKRFLLKKKKKKALKCELSSCGASNTI